MIDCLHTARSLEEPITLPYQEVIDGLEYGDIQEELGLMRMGSNYTFLVQVRHNENTFLGVYKPRLGERPLWDFPDGTLCQRETAAYLIAEALDWPIVPPTVMRVGSRGEGSLQAFVDHDPMQHYFTFEEKHDTQLQRIAAFDALVNNADRKGGHCLLDSDDHIWCIDHGLCFHAMDKLRTVIWDYAGQSLSPEIRTAFEGLCQQLEEDANPLNQRLLKLIEPYEHKALKTRLHQILSENSYPLPGAGPNRPWPAI